MTEVAIERCPNKKCVLPIASKSKGSAQMFSKIFEKSLWRSLFLVKLLAYNLQLYEKVSFFTDTFSRILQKKKINRAMHDGYFFVKSTFRAQSNIQEVIRFTVANCFV